MHAAAAKVVHKKAVRILLKQVCGSSLACADKALSDRLFSMQGECRTLLDGSLLAGNYAVNGGAFFAGTTPCFMVRLRLPTAATTLHDRSHKDQALM